MKKYVIESIELENCLKSNKDDLKLLECCVNCGKLPLPSYRSKTDPEKCLCNLCYISLNMNRDNLMIYNFKTESIILERLIFSCKNHGESCDEAFKLAELDQLMLHQENCDKKLTTKAHNILVNYLNDNDVRLNKIIKMFNDKIESIQESALKQQISFEEKF